MDNFDLLTPFVLPEDFQCDEDLLKFTELQNRQLFLLNSTDNFFIVVIPSSKTSQFTDSELLSSTLNLVITNVVEERKKFLLQKTIAPLLVLRKKNVKDKLEEQDIILFAVDIVNGSKPLCAVPKIKIEQKDFIVKTESGNVHNTNVLYKHSTTSRDFGQIISGFANYRYTDDYQIENENSYYTKPQKIQGIIPPNNTAISNNTPDSDVSSSKVSRSNSLTNNTVLSSSSKSPTPSVSVNHSKKGSHVLSFSQLGSAMSPVSSTLLSVQKNVFTSSNSINDFSISQSQYMGLNGKPPGMSHSRINSFAIVKNHSRTSSMWQGAVPSSLNNASTVNTTEKSDDLSEIASEEPAETENAVQFNIDDQKEQTVESDEPTKKHQLDSTELNLKGDQEQTNNDIGNEKIITATGKIDSLLQTNIKFNEHGEKLVSASEMYHCFSKDTYKMYGGNIFICSIEAVLWIENSSNFIISPKRVMFEMNRPHYAIVASPLFIENTNAKLTKHNPKTYIKLTDNGERQCIETNNDGINYTDVCYNLKITNILQQIINDFEQNSIDFYNGAIAKGITIKNIDSVVASNIVNSINLEQKNIQIKTSETMSIPIEITMSKTMIESIKSSIYDEKKLMNTKDNIDPAFIIDSMFSVDIDYSINLFSNSINKEKDQETKLLFSQKVCIPLPTDIVLVPNAPWVQYLLPSTDLMTFYTESPKVIDILELRSVPGYGIQFSLMANIINPFTYQNEIKDCKISFVDSNNPEENVKLISSENCCEAMPLQQETIINYLPPNSRANIMFNFLIFKENIKLLKSLGNVVKIPMQKIVWTSINDQKTQKIQSDNNSCKLNTTDQSNSSTKNNNNIPPLIETQVYGASLYIKLPYIEYTGEEFN